MFDGQRNTYRKSVGTAIPPLKGPQPYLSGMSGERLYHEAGNANRFTV